MSTMFKRLLSLAVALVMVIGLMPWNAVSVYAAEETTANTAWYDAEQTEFTIDTAAELLGLAELAKANNFAGKTVILGDDISLAGIAWTPIGTSATPFAGTFDGNHKTISDMSLTTSGNGGFFAYLCGAVKDLTVSGSISSTGGVTGGIAANIKSGASLSNVTSNVNISHTKGSNNGGVVGLILDKGTYTIENCSYNGTFTGSKSNGVGGILGNANSKGSTITITGCSVTGSISADAQVGGLIGNTHNTNTITISGSTNEAAITGTGNAVGGLVGTNGESSLTIENSSNSGAVTGKAVGAGGILGGFDATAGSVTTSGTTNTGTWYNANATAFTISSVDELLQFNELAKTYDFKGKTVNLSTDLDLTNVAWAPIGLHVDAAGTTVGKAFAGTFNGNGNTISGMKAEPSGRAGSWGFFGQIAGTLKNFTVSGSIEGAGSQVGGVTGALRSGAKLENVTSNVDLTITGSNVGGFAGRVEQAGTYAISGCTYGGTLSVTGSAVGGILGNANNKEATFNISNCTIAEDAEISGTNQVGGIVGNAHNGNTFTISGTNNADVSGNQQVGGIVGLLGDSVMTVSDSVNNGDITADDGHVAGIVGQMNGGADLTVTGCTNNGVIISGGSEFGGIVGTGRRTLTIKNTRNNGAVTATQGNDSIYYGAIVGSLYGDSEEKPCVVTFGGEEGVTYLPICSDQAYSLKVTEEGEKGSFVTVNGECTVYDPNPLGSETNPIIINEATELTSISVEAGKTIYYAINGQLNDCILTIENNENVTITLNGEEFSETAVLAGTPVNVLVITNNSEETITLVAEISHPGSTEQIAYHEATLELESLVYLNIYTEVDGEVDPDDMGLLIWTGDGAVSEEDFVVGNENVTAYPGATENNGYYAVQTPGIAAKNLGDELDMRVYWKQEDGTYVYSRPTNYGPQSYAKYQLENSTDENLKKTLVAMLDYAAAAQTYFGYNTTDLANDISGVDLTAYRGAYSQKMLKTIVAADASVAGDAVRSEECKSILPSLILKGIITNNYRFQFDAEIESAKVMFWSADKYAELLAAGTVLSAENASVVKEMTMGQDGYFKGGYDKTAVKDLGDTLYLCAEATTADGTVYTSGVVAHSAHDYIANMLGSGIENLDELLQALTVYGDSADTYFANR